MAQKIEVTLVDDLDGGKAEETVRFSLDGTAYEIDLSKKNAAKLRKGMEPFLTGARKAAKAGRKRGGASSTAGNRERSAAIREWARTSGIEVNARGRIPANVIEKYEASH
ncbi:Lsr2 family protein [Spirillospora sp. NPDC047279]|uniref:histone-like nucleoid-structuring protein Lsr2 n=1 Tax=Spirillospora sp. NPDC047279 TaxID=3155478 RepID=UPI00340574A7